VVLNFLYGSVKVLAAFFLLVVFLFMWRGATSLGQGAGSEDLFVDYAQVL